MWRSRCRHAGTAIDLSPQRNVTIDGSADSDEDIVVRIKADARVLRPDEPVPARPVL
jgi:hypothetical protein